MNKYLEMFLYIILDAITAVASFLLALLLTNNIYTHNMLFAFCLSVVILPTVLLFILYCFRAHCTIWKYANFVDYLKLVISSFFSVLCFFVVARSLNLGISVKTVILTAVFLSVLIIIQKYIIKLYMINRPTYDESESSPLKSNIMVIGAGSAGVSLIEDIQRNSSFSSTIKCIIDDDKDKWGKTISGISIIGGCDEIIPAAEKYNIDLIAFAIPACPSERKSAILKLCQKTGRAIRIIPSTYQILSNSEVNANSLRNVEIEDLLGRDPVKINLESVMSYVEGKVVMVTGGGGSIGSELCRQLAVHNPKQLIIFDIYENNAYDIQNELKRNYPELNLVTLIGSVRDSKRLNNIFAKYHPQIVYHAAAHKHVPLMEDSPNESIKNNVFGTQKTAACADKYGVEKFILISTDKAVNPTNIMGASKRICEMIIQTYNKHSDTDFVAVRFGNVLGSNGSVIPLFKKQIEAGGPVTVTDPNIIRYFMTIPEAVSLVLQSGATAKGGEIFVLDMGEPVKILDLAENLIKLSGYKPYEDIKIEFTGLRPGEKLYEELLMSEEGLKDTENRLIHIGRPIDIDEEKLKETLEKMKSTMYLENGDIRALVKDIVPTYRYDPNKVLIH